ncbi:MAG: hypothetical protein ACRD0D_01020 [Acidimicrobiales bacterium]
MSFYNTATMTPEEVEAVLANPRLAIAYGFDPSLPAHQQVPVPRPPALVPLGAAAPAASAGAARSLGEDPAYLAFTRALGAEEAEAAGEAQARTSALRRALGMRLPQIAEAGERAREAVGAGFESRGLFRSGARLGSLARQRAAEAAEAAGAVSATAEAQSDLERALARSRAARARQLSERGLSSAYSLSVEP